MKTIEDYMDRIWFVDSETFAYNNMWVFINAENRKDIRIIYDDNAKVRAFIRSTKPILCGYNIYGYDQYILSANLRDMSVEDIKCVNDLIISGGDDKFKSVFDFLKQAKQTVPLPPMIDLFHDIVPRCSLKSIEGNMGLSVKECDIPFDIDRPLTSEELTEVFRYCIQDVKAVAELFDARKAYLNSKITLCDICGENPLDYMQWSNARILSELFNAQPYKYKQEKYKIPDIIDTSVLPSEAIDYVKQCDTSVAERDTDIDKCTFTYKGLPTMFGIGGIHSATEKPYAEKETDERCLLLQDITSYYPSLILKYNYQSRATPPENIDMYKTFYDLRVKAKKNGDTATANAAKLVLNTYSGAMGSKYNKLYDPMMPLSLRLTGELFIMEAVHYAMKDAPSAKLIQLNTDGWLLSVNKGEKQQVLDGVKAWEEHSGFSVSTDAVRAVVQRDVNNYVMLLAGGNVKVKGGTVKLYGKRGNGHAAFDNQIMHEAIVNKLLYGKTIKDTVNACDDVKRFQIVYRAGRTYDYCVHERIVSALEVEYERLNLTNRVFASKDDCDGKLYKVKTVNGEQTKHTLPNCPQNCFVHNEKISKLTIDKINKDWYIDYAIGRYNEFINGLKGSDVVMADNTTVAKKTTPTRKKKETSKTTKTTAKATKPKVKSLPEKAVEQEPKTLVEALYKMQVLMSGNSSSVKFDGYISNIDYAYADTQQYKLLLSKCANECGLVFSVNVAEQQPTSVTTKDGTVLGFDGTGRFLQDQHQIDTALNGVEMKNTETFNLSRNKMIGYEVELIITFTFVKTGESASYKTVGVGVGMMGNSCSIAITNALRNFITNNFMLDNKGRDGDDVKSNFISDIAQKASKPYASKETKAEIKKELVEENKQKQQYATITYAKALYAKIQRAMEVNPDFEKKVAGLLEKAYKDGEPIVNGEDKNRSLIKQVGASKLMRVIERILENE